MLSKIFDELSSIDDAKAELYALLSKVKSADNIAFTREHAGKLWDALGENKQTFILDNGQSYEWTSQLELRHACFFKDNHQDRSKLDNFFQKLQPLLKSLNSTPRPRANTAPAPVVRMRRTGSSGGLETTKKTKMLKPEEAAGAAASAVNDMSDDDIAKILTKGIKVDLKSEKCKELVRICRELEKKWGATFYEIVSTKGYGVDFYKKLSIMFNMSNALETRIERVGKLDAIFTYMFEKGITLSPTSLNMVMGKMKVMGRLEDDFVDAMVQVGYSYNKDGRDDKLPIRKICEAQIELNQDFKNAYNKFIATESECQKTMLSSSSAGSTSASALPITNMSSLPSMSVQQYIPSNLHYMPSFAQPAPTFHASNQGLPTRSNSVPAFSNPLSQHVFPLAHPGFAAPLPPMSRFTPLSMGNLPQLWTPPVYALPLVTPPMNLSTGTQGPFAASAPPPGSRLPPQGGSINPNNFTGQGAGPSFPGSFTKRS